MCVTWCCVSEASVKRLHSLSWKKCHQNSCHSMATGSPKPLDLTPALSSVSCLMSQWDEVHCINTGMFYFILSYCHIFYDVFLLHCGTVKDFFNFYHTSFQDEVTYSLVSSYHFLNEYLCRENQKDLCSYLCNVNHNFFSIFFFEQTHTYRSYDDSTVTSGAGDTFTSYEKT